jgi:hypothetical protein
MSELYTESFKERKAQEDMLMKKWDKALNADGGIKNEHLARTTAILLENYMSHLKSDSALIAEDQIQSGSFSGVNLALLGLIRRTIPALVGSELVGIQAMPTPTSPLFYMSWRKGASDGTENVGLPKGGSQSGDELFGYPGSASSQIGQADPYFTSSLIRNQVVTASVANNGTYTIASTYWAPILSYSLKVYGLDSNNEVVGSVWLNEATPGSSSVSSSNGQLSVTLNTSGSFTRPTITVATGAGAVAAGIVKIIASWEYKQEANTVAPELNVQIDEFNIKLVRRMLRGRFTLDSITDAKAYHGIALENELMEIMKLELMNEINREIITDLRSMAAISGSIDYTSAAINNVVGNYDDMHKLLLDKINGLSAEILNQSRLGRGNFIVGNPVTLAFLDRVSGFVGAGASFDGKGLTFAGQVGKRLNFYFDPQFPQNELLIGYKGSSALDTGYIHAPYLPITSTPTLYNPQTGDPSKIFYTRYGKSYRDVDATTGMPYNAIYRGEYSYARLFLQNFPTI